MYVSNENIDGVTQKLFSLLKDDGKLILIEPLESGEPFFNAFGLLKNFNTKRKTTGGNSFKSKELISLIENNGGTIISKKIIPVTSVFIIPIYAICKVLGHKLSTFFLKFIKKTDSILTNTALPSMSMALVIRKKNAV
jgi:hypothetical protein